MPFSCGVLEAGGLLGETWLKDQARKARHNAIAEYAEEMAGTERDLERELESAGIEHLIATGRVRK